MIATKGVIGAVRSGLSRLFILAIGMVIGLMVTEGLLRWVLPGSSEYFAQVPGMARRFRPLPGTMEGVEGVSRFTINSAGIRGEEFQTNDGQEYRILAVGGSTTEALYLDDLETWTYLLQEHLDQTPDGRKVWVGNVGKAGANSRDNLLHIKYLLPQYAQIDLVLVLVGVNDLNVALARGEEYSLPPPISDPDVEAEQLRRAFIQIPGRLPDRLLGNEDRSNMPWYRKTATFVILKEVKSRVGWLLSARGLRKEFVGGWEYPPLRAKRQAGAKIDELPDLALPLADYAHNLNMIIDVATANGADVILMTQPALWRDDLSQEEENLLWFGGLGDFLNEPGHPYYTTPLLVEAMDRYNDQLLQVCEAREINCIDLAAQVPGTVENFYDDVHFTEQGARLVADVISKHLSQWEPFSTDSSND